MPGVERLMVVNSPLAANQEDIQGPGLVQRSSDFVSSYGITPQAAFVGTMVGLFMEPTISGGLKGLLLGSLVSFVVNKLQEA